MPHDDALREASQPFYPWRLFCLLLAGAIFGVLAVLPYLSVVLAPTLAAHPLRLPLPLIALLQGTTNFGIAASLGLLLAGKLGLGASILEAWLYHRPLPPVRKVVLISCVTGVILGVIILGLLRTPLGAALANLPITTERTMSLGKRFLACFYGGLCEEILMRLFLLSLVIWLGTKIWRSSSPNARASIFWISNLLVALAFGAGHLPLAAQLTKLTPAIVTAVISLNAFCALGFGYLYWKLGLEAAMIAHFCVDILLHVIGPTLA